MKRVYVMLASVFMIACMSETFLLAQPANSQETLSQYLSELKKNPNDHALREKIIKHVRTMQPAPGIPEEARRFFVEGNVLLKAAKDRKGQELAVDAYRKCLLVAPWWAEAYYNHGVALELANRFDEAADALKLYIATNPGDGEARKAQDKIYEIGAKKKLTAAAASGATSPPVATQEQKTIADLLAEFEKEIAAAAKPQARRAAGLAGLAGTWRTYSIQVSGIGHVSADPAQDHCLFELRGGEIVATLVLDKDVRDPSRNGGWRLKGEAHAWFRLNRLLDRRLTGRFEGAGVRITGIASEDGNEIVIEWIDPSGDRVAYTLRRDQ